MSDSRDFGKGTNVGCLDVVEMMFDVELPTPDVSYTPSYAFRPADI